MFFYLHDIWIAWFHLFPTGHSAGKTASQEGRSAWAAFWVILVGLVVAAAGAYLVYKYRIRVSLVPFSQFSDAISFLFYSILSLYSMMACNEIHQIPNQIWEHVIYHLPVFFIGVFAVVYGFRDQSHHGTVYALGQPIRGCKSCERWRKSVRGEYIGLHIYVWSLGVAYPVVYLFWVHISDHMNLILYHMDNKRVQN